MNRADAEEYTASLGQIGGGLWRQILWAARQGVPDALGLTLREWVDGRLGGYVRMAIDERRQVVGELTAEGLSQRQIADVVGVDDRTVGRDQDAAFAASHADGDCEQDSEAAANAASEFSDADRAAEIQDLARQQRPEPAVTPPLPHDRFACLVIDPPWPVKKIERSVRVWQGVDLDYPTMTVDQIGDLPVADLAEPDAHLYLWVTHRFLPDGLHLAERWGFRYQCLLTWNKGTGMVPFSWMYNTEHVIFATRGNLKVAKRGMGLWLEEPPTRDRHSTKPEVFYDRVRLASPEPRLDMFARRERAGFTAWGNEVQTA